MVGRFRLFGPNPLSPPRVFKCATLPSPLPWMTSPAACLITVSNGPPKTEAQQPGFHFFGPNLLPPPHVVKCTTPPSPPPYSYPPPQPPSIDCHQFFQRRG